MRKRARYRGRGAALSPGLGREWPGGGTHNTVNGMIRKAGGVGCGGGGDEMNGMDGPTVIRARELRKQKRMVFQSKRLWIWPSRTRPKQVYALPMPHKVCPERVKTTFYRLFQAKNRQNRGWVGITASVENIVSGGGSMGQGAPLGPCTGVETHLGRVFKEESPKKRSLSVSHSGVVEVDAFLLVWAPNRPSTALNLYPRVTGLVRRTTILAGSRTNFTKILIFTQIKL